MQKGQKKTMEVNKTEERFLSADGQNRIHYAVYRPSGTVKAVVQISHGMCEHIGRYEEFAMLLAEHGYAVYAHDHLGHGGSVKTQEDFGYFGEESGWQFLVDDLYEVTKIARREYPLQKIFLFGHSMGSFIARLYLIKYGEKLSGIILSGTSGGHQLNNVGLAFTDCWMKLKGKRHRSNTIQKMMFGSYNKRYPDVKTESDWLTRDSAAVEAYRRDKRNMFVFTNSGFKDLLTMLKMISDERWAKSVPKTVPIFLLSGDMDPVGDYGNGVKKVYDRLLEAGVEHVKLRLYAGGRHEMLNEINREEVYQDILSWLDEN